MYRYKFKLRTGWIGKIGRNWKPTGKSFAANLTIEDIRILLGTNGLRPDPTFKALFYRYMSYDKELVDKPLEYKPTSLRRELRKQKLEKDYKDSKVNMRESLRLAIWNAKNAKRDLGSYIDKIKQNKDHIKELRARYEATLKSLNGDK